MSSAVKAFRGGPKPALAIAAAWPPGRDADEESGEPQTERRKSLADLQLSH